MIEIRKATKKDVNEICKINDELADYHTRIDSYYSPAKNVRKSFKDKLVKRINKKDFLILVAVDKNKIVGYFVSEIIESKEYKVEKKIGYIHTAYITENYRRMGLGNEMYDLTKFWFKKNKIKYVELTVDSRNKIGNSAWNKIGFEEYMKKMKLKL